MGRAIVSSEPQALCSAQHTFNNVHDYLQTVLDTLRRQIDQLRPQFVYPPFMLYGDTPQRFGVLSLLLDSAKSTSPIPDGFGVLKAVYTINPLAVVMEADSIKEAEPTLCEGFIPAEATDAESAAESDGSSAEASEYLLPGHVIAVIHINFGNPELHSRARVLLQMPSGMQDMFNRLFIVANSIQLEARTFDSEAWTSQLQALYQADTAVANAFGMSAVAAAQHCITCFQFIGLIA